MRVAADGARIGYGRLLAPIRSLTLGGTLLAGLMAARWASGLPPNFQIPYWYLSYTTGFTRRGLIGTLTMPLLVGRPLAQAALIVTLLGLAATAALLILLVRLLRGAPPPVALAFVGASTLPWLAYELGMLDPWMMLASVAALAALERRPAIAVGLSLIAPLVHEGSLWLLLPALAVLALRRPRLRVTAALAAVAALASGAALCLFATGHVIWPAGMPTELSSNPELADFVAWQLAQSPRLYWPVFGWRIVVFAVLPGAIIVAEVAREIGWKTGAAVALAAAASTTAIALAVDTDRLAAWGPLTATVLAALLLRTREGPAPAG